MYHRMEWFAFTLHRLNAVVHIYSDIFQNEWNDCVYVCVCMLREWQISPYWLFIFRITDRVPITERRLILYFGCGDGGVGGDRADAGDDDADDDGDDGGADGGVSRPPVYASAGGKNNDIIISSNLWRSLARTTVGSRSRNRSASRKDWTASAIITSRRGLFRAATDATECNDDQDDDGVDACIFRTIFRGGWGFISPIGRRLCADGTKMNEPGDSDVEFICIKTRAKQETIDYQYF